MSSHFRRDASPSVSSLSSDFSLTELEDPAPTPSEPGRIALRKLRMGLGGRRRASDASDREALLHDGERRRSSYEPDDEPTRPADSRPSRQFLRRISSRMSVRGTTQAREPSPVRASNEERTVRVGGGNTKQKFPPNIISNHKFTPLTFLPLTLYNEFKFFFNLYFLLVALSQIIPALRIGFLSTYIVPLVFVLTVTLGKEAHDDIARRRRDAEANSEAYEVLALSDDSEGPRGRGLTLGRGKHGGETRERGWGEGEVLRTVVKKSRDLKVGDILVLKKDQRVPADVVILQSVSNDAEDDEGGEGKSGEAFIRTDQLDGETDWKLRIAPALTQKLPVREMTGLVVNAAAPSKEVNDFMGSLSWAPVEGGGKRESVGLSIDNTAWSNTVLASNSTTLGAVVYTGPETRAALSTSKSRSKTGLLELEINNLTKILCALTFTLSIILVALRGFDNEPDRPGVSNPNNPEEVVSGKWYVRIMRFLILFSTIIPISLRVNLDMGKSAYAYFIEKDQAIPGTVVRTSTIPEELGRVEYLLSDKTGTLTQNDMELKKVHVGTVSYGGEAMEEVGEFIRQGFSGSGEPAEATGTRARREIGARVRDLVLALALCHNVTPTNTSDEDGGESGTSYQASSPDEIAIVRWTESVGLRLVHRDRRGMKLQSVDTGKIAVTVKILEVFPFTSEGKRMGIVVQFVSGDPAELDLLGGETGKEEGEIWFYQKGADTVMSAIVASNDWLDEECGNMAREGLRTLVIGRKKLSSDRYKMFAQQHSDAQQLLQGRDEAVQSVVAKYLEHDLELLGVTGVEDKLQKDVKPSLELLRNAGIKIWMLTGDKVETARCVAVSAKLVARGQYIHTVAKMKSPDAAYNALDILRTKPDSCLLIDGESLALLLAAYRDEFITLAVRLPAVVACRCTPTQKADIARLIREHTKKRICCIGDGGNDVSMIQAADVGVGIVGKEGRQASLAADFSITQFCHLTKLLVWHGRNSYKRSAKLAQFVMHRGLVISVCQTMFSIASKFEPIALYQGWLMVGYATLYTMFPVFSLVLDRDVSSHLAHLYPELYAELTEGRSLSYRTFFVWVLVSVYQGSMIQGLSQILIGLENFKQIVTVSFTVLVLNELIMVALEITTWHMYMIFAEVGTFVLFCLSIPALGDYFDLGYVITGGFAWRVVAILAVSAGPVGVVKWGKRRWRPPSYAKVRGI